MAEQLTFDLPARAALGRGDFFVSPANAAAVAAVDAWETWPRGVMVISGPPGSGKTHLAHVWASTAGATIRTASEIRGDAVPELAAAGPTAVEDLDAGALDEEAFFHFYNLMQAARSPLLITATKPPANWGIRLPDLRSRLEAAPVVTLSAPDDALLQAVLVKLFADRQIAVAPNVIAFLVERIDRSFAAAHEIVGRLDRAALAEGRAVTRALAARLLDKDGTSGA